MHTPAICAVPVRAWEIVATAGEYDWFAILVEYR